MPFELSTLLLRADVAALATPEGRRVGSAGHDRARDFLCKRLSSLGLEHYHAAASYSLPYRTGGQAFFNVVGVVPGADRQARPVLLGAHYDSVLDAPCADDNAAAVAITLAVAERLRHHAQQPARDVLVTFFDAEEPPYFLSPAMGSIRFGRDQMDARGVGCALIQDLTGHDVRLPLPLAGGTAALPEIKDLVFMTGAESHPQLASLVGAALAGTSGSDDNHDYHHLPLVAARNAHVGDMSDHHIFRTLGLPYLFFSCGRWEHYHQRSDTPEKLNYEKMARLAALLSDVTLHCAAHDLSLKVAAGEGETDTTIAFEIELLERAFGPALLPALLRLAGVPKLRGRADLNALAAALTSSAGL